MCGRGEIGFCKPECRDDYITEELRKERQKRDAGSRGTNMVPTMADGKDGGGSSIFFAIR
jgi:hypothetical protein